MTGPVTGAGPGTGPVTGAGTGPVTGPRPRPGPGTGSAIIYMYTTGQKHALTYAHAHTHTNTNLVQLQDAGKKKFSKCDHIDVDWGVGEEGEEDIYQTPIIDSQQPPAPSIKHGGTTDNIAGGEHHSERLLGNRWAGHPTPKEAGYSSIVAMM